MLGWRQKYFTERQKRLIANCQGYAKADPAGMPGHQLALIIDRMTDVLDAYEEQIRAYQLSAQLPPYLRQRQDKGDG